MASEVRNVVPQIVEATRAAQRLAAEAAVAAERLSSEAERLAVGAAATSAWRFFPRRCGRGCTG